MNRVSLGGRLVRDPELKTTVNGKSLCTFTLANEVRSGENKKTNYFRVTAWGNQANVIAQYCKKGQQLFLIGRLDQNNWKDANGVSRSEVNVILESFDFGQKPMKNDQVQVA